MGYNKKLDITRSIAWIISVFMFCVVLSLMYYIFFYRPPEPTYPHALLTVEENNEVYTLRLDSCYDPEEALTLSDVEVYVKNGTTHYNISVIANYALADILNTQGSNITFYDNDNNGRLSVGDEFIIRGDLVTDATYITGTYTPYKNTVFVCRLT